MKSKKQKTEDSYETDAAIIEQHRAVDKIVFINSIEEIYQPTEPEWIFEDFFCIEITPSVEELILEIVNNVRQIDSSNKKSDANVQNNDSRYGISSINSQSFPLEKENHSAVSSHIVLSNEMLLHRNIPNNLAAVNHSINAQDGRFETPPKRMIPSPKTAMSPLLKNLK
ncbi:hypothetical protein NPIL_191241 [Nephila pilipes]|uniref:Uncharacterized protein n=1 Tax=Nephila pilipes TaxID=299642 RepID=A0A8X6N4N1_NEPPI|nr:hypothetical protein NPIL_191241 [Nephila pilipes]